METIDLRIKPNNNTKEDESIIYDLISRNNGKIEGIFVSVREGYYIGYLEGTLYTYDEEITNTLQLQIDADNTIMHGGGSPSIKNKKDHMYFVDMYISEVIIHLPIELLSGDLVKFIDQKELELVY